MAKADLTAKFGARIRSLREARGLTQEDLAQQIARTVDTVSNIERGVHATGIEVASRIAVALKVDLVELYDLIDAPSHPIDRERRRVLRDITVLLNDLDAKALGTVQEILQGCVKLIGNRRSGRAGR